MRDLLARMSGYAGAEAAVPRGVRAQRAEEVHPAERGPVGVAEVELGVGALPQQEAAQALLPRGPDHQVRVGLAGRVQVLGDVLDVEDLGQLLDGGPPGGVVLEQGADRVRDLPPPAVADRHVDQQAPGRRSPRRRPSAPGPSPAGSRSRAPTGLTRQPPSTSSRTVSSMIRSSGSSSLAGRLRLSVDSSHRVTTSTPACWHHSSSSKILSAPFWCPRLTSVMPADRAHRRLPSHITPTCRAGSRTPTGAARAAAHRGGRRACADPIRHPSSLPPRLAGPWRSPPRRPKRCGSAYPEQITMANRRSTA